MHEGASHAETTKHLIAQMAARLMAEHGIRDHALAKRKALRQLGLPAGHVLPGNDEIDAALREYRELFEPEVSQSELSALRHAALQAMIDLEPFAPRLVGAVASGAVSRHSEIELELYLDSSKAFEQFLMREGIEYESRDRGGQAYFLLYAEPVDVRVRVLPESAERQGRPGRETTPRLTRARLEKILAESGDVAAMAKSG
jgi:hypothetical protein